MILSSEIIAFSANPSISEIILTTNSGNIVLAIKREQAEALLDQLANFLDTGQQKARRS
jgi:hypothetical protein